jgi:Na+-transporting NADH:ubiquinone oxidoreductase subunit F
MGGIAAILSVILVILDHYLANYDKCNIRINSDMDYTVEGGESLLSCLTSNKIFIPSACGGKATCGFCKVKILEGGGPVLPTEKPFLTRNELLDNVRLACQIKVKSDIQVIIPEEYLSIQEFEATVSEVYNLNHDTREIILKLEEPGEISFKPGQYIQFQIPDTSEYRAYSIASPPSRKGSVKLIVRLVLGGCCSTYIHKDLQVGDKVYFTGPYGDFYLREDSGRDIICIGGGCGMAPFLSIIQHLFEKGTNRNITYYYGARAKKDLYYMDELQRFAEEHPNFKLIIALSDPEKDDDWTGEVGFIHKVLDKYIENAYDTEAYLCGPPVMIDATIGVLISKGLSEDHIFFDKFQ